MQNNSTNVILSVAVVGLIIANGVVIWKLSRLQQAVAPVEKTATDVSDLVASIKKYFP